MKIENRGIRITEVPGVESIESCADGGTEIVFRYEQDVISFDREALTQFRDALNVILGQDAAAPAITHWERIEDVPERVKIVLDREGDPWYLAADGLWSASFEGASMGEDYSYVNRWAPFRPGNS